MAPSRSQPVKNGAGNRLAIPSKKKSLASITTTTTNNGHTLTTSSSTSDLNSGYLLPTALVPHPFERPMSSGSLPATPRFRKYRKNMKDFTGFDTTEDEFETLPLAVRRKYFSSLERLRLAERTNSQTLDELPIQHPRRSSLASRRNASITELKRDSLSPRRPRKGSSSNNEASWFLSLPPKIKRKNFTAEERIMLDGRLQDKVILDAADEAVFKARRRASRNLSTVDPFSEPSLPITLSSSSFQGMSGSMLPEVYESFRWMDEDSDLDLRLGLDDYHANLDGVVIPDPSSNRRPSFRRQVSISKIPFGRPSISSLQPRSPRTPRSESINNAQTRQRSRTLSIISPKHTVQNSVVSIDPNATHYQDPEARLKLRVYLASPQKFDEAIEFGFPSLDGMTSGDDKENRCPVRSSKDVPNIKKSFASGQSFLDDTASLFDDDVSMADPESPITPAIDGSFERRSSITLIGNKSTKSSADYSHLGISKPVLVRQHSEGYAQAVAGNREMTLRMTLTRPDLRADESKIYGWQNSNSPKSRNIRPLIDDLDEKFEVRGPYGGADGWGPAEKDNGGLKRFWNRVKSSQRKG